jgi:hypothetical protein
MEETAAAAQHVVRGTSALHLWGSQDAAVSPTEADFNSPCDCANIHQI